jgi:chromosome segregation ATPase
MTYTRYFVCLVAQGFGYNRRNVRVTQAAAESHLLREAESHLGKGIWQKVEKIEALSVEYWNLRKLVKEYDRVAFDLEARQNLLETAHEERASLLSATNEPFQDLVEQRQSILQSLEEFARQRDMAATKAGEVRRAYDGLKTKEEVLIKEQNHSEQDFAIITERLAQLKLEFSTFKDERFTLGEKIAEGNAKVDKIDAEIQRRKKERREKASEAFQHIGDANHEMSTLRAELGVLDTQMRQLYTEIGKHVSREATKDPECRAICKEFRGLIDVMNALRKSIQLNFKLIDKI